MSYSITELYTSTDSLRYTMENTDSGYPHLSNQCPTDLLFTQDPLGEICQWLVQFDPALIFRPRPYYRHTDVH